MGRSCVLVFAGVSLAAFFSGGPVVAGLYDWHGAMVDSGVDVGAHVSVAVDGPRGVFFIAYYAQDTHDLKVARYVGSGGDCGTDNAWRCQVVDSAGDVGMYPSIDVRSGEVGPEVAVSYYDAGNGALKIAWGQCDAAGCSWGTQTIDSANPAAGGYKGRHTALKIDNVGGVHIAYQYYSVGGDEHQLYASLLQNPVGNCGEGYWACVTLFSGPGVGEYSALDLDASNRPTIAFYDRGAGYPRVMTYVGSGGTCGPGNEWLCRDAHMGGQDAGRFMSMYLDASGVAHLAFYNATEETLVYAFPDPADSDDDNNCGFSSASLDWEWQCEEIEVIGSSLFDMGIAIVGDGPGEPIIAYQVTDPVGPAVLKAARPYHLTDGSVGANCGPVRPGDLFQYWSCEVVDNAGSYDLQEAAAVGMTTGPDGNPIIAYHELFTHPYPSEGRVKMVYHPCMLIFQDAFESADAGWWSSTTP